MKLGEGLALGALLPLSWLGVGGRGLCLRAGGQSPQLPAGDGRSPRPPPAHLRQRGHPHLRSRQTPRVSAPTRQPEVPPTPPQGLSAGAAFRLSGAMPKAPFIFLSRGLVNMEPASGDMGMLG